MKLRGINFGSVLGAAGVQGFNGEGYSFHRRLGPLGPNFDGMTFVSKTTTLHANPGNMPLRPQTWEPWEFKPKCIAVNWWQQTPLNAVALSGPGAERLLEGRYPNGTLREDRWTARAGSFLISYMPIKKARDERLQETRDFVALLKQYLPRFRGRVALQFNATCPNTGLKVEDVVEETHLHLDILAELDIPIMPKLNLLVPAEAAIEISKHAACDAICMTNAILFGKMPEEIDWDKLFPKGSPLAKFGGGALSGPTIFPLVVRWVRSYFAGGGEKPLNAGGGITYVDDVYELMHAGLRPGIDSIFIGSAAMLRPWGVQGLIRTGNAQLHA